MQETDELVAEAESFEVRHLWNDAVDAWSRMWRERGDVVCLLRAATAAQDGGMPTVAEELSREAVRHAPNRAEPHFVLGTVRRNQRRFDEARAALQEGLKLTESQFALTILGVVQFNVGDVVAAQETLHRSIEMNPLDDEADFALGVSLIREDPDAAIEQFRRALEIDPRFAGGHRHLGDALCLAGKEHDAEGVLTEVDLIRFGGRVDYVDLVSLSFVEESLQGLGGIRIGIRCSRVAAGERPVAI